MSQYFCIDAGRRVVTLSATTHESLPVVGETASS